MRRRDCVRRENISLRGGTRQIGVRPLRIVGGAAAASGFVVCDSAYAASTILEGRPERVHVISRLRMDAALWTSPPPRRPGQKGRPRKKGRRLPHPTAIAAQCRKWRALPVTIYGREVTTRSFSFTAPVSADICSPPLIHSPDTPQDTPSAIFSSGVV